MPTRPSPRSERLGTPNTPAIRFTRGPFFEASLVRICYGLSGCSPPWTDLTEFPRPPGTFTSRLPAGRSPFPPLDMTTTATGLLCWRDFHPQEWQLSSSSVVGQRMAVSLGVERSNRFVDGAVEVIRAGERLMSEVMPLEVAPETLDIVQLRSIFRQPLDGEPVGALGERGAACLAGVDRAVVEDEHEGLERDAELGTIAAVDLLQESDEVRAWFGSAGLNNELATRPVEHPEHRHFGALARRWDAQVGPLLRPDVRQVRVGEGFGLVCEQERDGARLGLSLEQLSAQALPVHGVGVLPTFQCVAGSPPAKAPFFRSTTESREREMRTPARVSISSARRGSVQFGRSATGPDRTSSATARARSALTGAGPGATDVFRASMPPVMKALRQKRTVSSRTPKAWAIWPLVQPERVSKIARARSASPRSRERLSAIRARL